VKIIDGAGAFTGASGAAHWVEQLRVPDLSVGTYSIPAGSIDDQTPHTEDEIYVVMAGRATFEAGGDRVTVGPGSVLYVPAGEVHRFTDVSEDLATVVIFAPAEETRSRQAGAGTAFVATAFVTEYVAAFNAAVAAGDYAPLLRWFSDDAVLRFENVPPAAATLEFVGRPAYTAAYAETPPDDQIDLAGEPRAEGGHMTVAFAWRRDRSPGVLDFVIADGVISSLTVRFGQMSRSSTGT
jgi:mannose-6-phosphate isomerase-like protein (cupin superfamily)